jgi:hypothetical protein
MTTGVAGAATELGQPESQLGDESPRSDCMEAVELVGIGQEIVYLGVTVGVLYMAEWSIAGRRIVG